MVDVRGVEQPDSRTGVVSLSGKVLFSPTWLYAHYVKQNVVLKQEFNQILSSKKFSWRIFAEMLLDLERGLVPSWAQLQWVVLDLQSHQIKRVTEPVGLCVLRFAVGDITIDPGAQFYSISDTGGICVPSRATAVQEYQYNQLMLKLFGRKFPMRLEMMTPWMGEVKVNIPVDAASQPTPQIGSPTQMLWAEIAKGH